jgi:hypothetical protein
VVAGGDIGDEKRRTNGVKRELRQAFSNGLESFDADAFLEQLGPKQGASLPVLAGEKHLSHEHIIRGFRIRDSGFRTPFTTENTEFSETTPL